MFTSDCDYDVPVCLFPLLIVCAFPIGSSGIVYIDPAILRRSSVNPVSVALSTNQDSTLSVSTTSSQLARSFGIVIRQVKQSLVVWDVIWKSL